MSEKIEKKVEFDEILEKVGSYGKFQKKFNYLFNLFFLILVCMPIMNIFIAMAVPEHWCYVPGRENTNFTIDEWKEITIPRINNESSKNTGNLYPSCKMYENFSLGEEIVDCQFGYDFDKTYYIKTIPAVQEWVCDKNINVANAFVFQRMGDIFGNLIFGHLGDTYGRLLIFYLTLSTLLFGRIALLFTSTSAPLFMFACFLGGMGATSIFQAPLVIAMEISDRKAHAYTAMLQCVGWTIGFCIIPFIMWWLKDWVPFLLITTLPATMFFFTHHHMIESPRWLFSKGKRTKCLKVLKKIAKINEIEVDEDLEKMVLKGTAKIEKIYGVMSMFSHWRFAKNFILLITGWSIINLFYYVLTMNIDNMGGNPHMNFFWQGLAELPGYVLGKISCDKIGRKWTNFIGFIGIALGSIPTIFTANNQNLQLITLIFVVYLKFSTSLAFYGVNLQALETFPTPIRQTGSSLGGITANIFGLLGPYIVYLGTTYHSAFPYVISFVLATLYAVAILFLPETLGEKLPETLSEAYKFGKDQPYWYFPKSSHFIVPNKE